MGGSQSFRIKKIGTQKKSVQATSEIIYTLEHDKTWVCQHISPLAAPAQALKTVADRIHSLWPDCSVPELSLKHHVYESVYKPSEKSRTVYKRKEKV